MPSVPKINQLPHELLALIFATGLRDLSSDAQRPILALICSICHHWRDVAVGASELWTTIHISSERHLPAAQAFLERSKDRLIDVVVDGVYAPEQIYSSAIAMITAVQTAPHIFRVRTLTMTLYDLNIYNVFSNVYRSISATNLASLSIRLANDFWPFLGYPSLFENTKSLCHFDTQGNFLTVVPSRADLTTLELSNYSPTHVDIQKLFNASSCLEPLARPNEDDGAPITITAPTTLKSLAVSVCYTHSNGTSMCGCVLDKLCIPKLEYLEELAKLQTLRLQRCRITSADQFFLSLKELRRLELVDMSPELVALSITRDSIPSRRVEQ
ncbi:hypothetical protein ARMGADRAFT_1073600 [Armillaria gallica]|uniref:Uncharacterized protein n=1 Tax=Armillaria gallica TaxID=47427 RepID=A0A2H3E587_ARMGA|nr:hypothetical protein ARMGADRAFT_1073600 [Armillaria gallica]